MVKGPLIEGSLHNILYILQFSRLQRTEARMSTLQAVELSTKGWAPIFQTPLSESKELFLFEIAIKQGVNIVWHYLRICFSAPGHFFFFETNLRNFFYSNSNWNKVRVEAGGPRARPLSICHGAHWQLLTNCPSPAPFSRLPNLTVFDEKTKAVTSPEAPIPLLVYFCLTDKECRCHL